MMTFALILHIFGVALGAGGAFMSDALFFHFLHRRDFSESNLKILRIGSRMVWTGLAVLFISGLVLFWAHADYYLHSSKFLIKMTVVLVIAINGMVFHRVHMKRMGKLASGLFVSGAISMTSWISVIVLGTLRSLSLSYFSLLGLYIILITAASLIALAMRKKFL